MSKSANELINFINGSPSCFHVIYNLKNMLSENGYIELSENTKWELTPGNNYFVIRNGSSLLAFSIPLGETKGFMLAAAHSDSPTFKVKDTAESVVANLTRLSTEKYGGILMSSWLDRPLSVAGRVVVNTEKGVAAKLVNVDRDLLIIPNVAIHMNRSANENASFAANIDTLPLFGGENAKGKFLSIIADAADVSANDILDKDLYLYLRESGRILGAENEFVASPKLDDLECAFAITRGFLSAKESNAIKVLAIFDNEEVGSETKQGAGSSFLRDTLRRVTTVIGKNEEDFLSMLANSFLVSADNAHATHPNHPEYADALNSPHINGGVVIKYNANQRYTTDAVSAAIFKKICFEANVPVQAYANRSDLPGGSTLGSISNTLLPVRTVDIGLAQLAMHSSYETAGVKDLDYLVAAMTAFYSSDTIVVE